MATHQHFISLQKKVTQQLHSDYFYCQNQTFSRSDLFAHALQLSHLLPENKYALNLCNDRYLFTVSFLAVLLRRQINLLPPNQAPHTIEKLINRYQQSYCITDNPEISGPDYFIVENGFTSSNENTFPPIDINQTAAISFTSGSTGTPRAVVKTWREFQSSAQLAIQRFNLNARALSIVSTVPPQHTYGLETSLFWPLFSTASINNRQPFFPEDIRQATALSANPCLLITTPTHIKACVRAGLSWNNIEMILSSTAPLSTELAKLTEHAFNAPVFEIFGCTETLSFASRRLTVSAKWEPYLGISLTDNTDAFTVSGGHLQVPTPIDDQFQIDKSGHFTLKGRSTEIVKVAGKRTSISELNHIINNIDGIEDAMFFQTGTERLGALVKGRLTKSEILQILKLSIDEVFLPRPLYLVDNIPRNEVGKIIKTKLENLIKDLTVV